MTDIFLNLHSLNIYYQDSKCTSSILNSPRIGYVIMMNNYIKTMTSIKFNKEILTTYAMQQTVKFTDIWDIEYTFANVWKYNQHV